jgi:hypothetical protein
MKRIIFKTALIDGDIQVDADDSVCRAKLCD